MLTLLLAAPLLAGTTRLCATTEANASANGGWEVLGRSARDGRLDTREGQNAARAAVDVQFGGERTEDLCPAYDPMGGVGLAARTDLLEVELPQPGAVGGCYTTALATARGGAEGEAWVDATRIRARAGGRSAMEIAATNSGRMDADGGAGAAFVGEWAYRGGGPNTAVSGTVTIDLADAYAGAWIGVPGLVYAEAWDGNVRAWARQGDRYVKVEGPAPLTIAVDTVLPGRSGAVCASGSASVGARGDEENGGFESASGLDLALDVTGTSKAALPLQGESPSFGECGCR